MKRSFFGNYQGRTTGWAGLWGAPQKRELLGVARRCLRYAVTAIHDRVYTTQRERVASLRISEEELATRTAAAPTVMCELVSKLHDPTVERVQTTPGAEIVDQIFDALEDDHRFTQLQRLCRCKPGLASHIASSLIDSIVPHLPEPEPQEPGGYPDDDDDDDDGVRYPGCDPSTDDEEDDDDAPETVPVVIDWGVEDAMDKALDDAAQVVKDIQGAVAAFGLDDPKTHKDHEEIAVLMETLDDEQVKEIMLIAGRTAHFHDDKARFDTIENRGERTEVTRGQSIRDALLPEIARLVEEGSKPLALKRIAAKELQQWGREDQEARGKGPVVFCADRSYSMRGERLKWVKALLLGLGRVAAMENRAFQVIWYNEVVTHSTLYPAGTGPTALLAELKRTASGCTAFGPPLQRAIESIRGSRTFRQADIVFLTDGEARAPGDWFKKACDELSVNTLGIVVASAQTLPFTDATVNVKELTIEAASAVLTEVEE
jgi:Mg-chelatase subunit ChlD